MGSSEHGGKQGRIQFYSQLVAGVVLGSKRCPVHPLPSSQTWCQCEETPSHQSWLLQPHLPPSPPSSPPSLSLSSPSLPTIIIPSPHPIVRNLARFMYMYIHVCECSIHTAREYPLQTSLMLPSFPGDGLLVGHVREDAFFQGLHAMVCQPVMLGKMPSSKAYMRWFVSIY